MAIYGDVTWDEIVQTLNVFDEPPRRFHAPDKRLDFGMRLDGVELIALATPSLLDKGFEYGSIWIVPAISPILPLFPEWEQELKASDSVNSKWAYMSKHTTIEMHDYVSCSLTETWVNFGPFGFPIAAIAFGWAMSRGTRLIQHGASKRDLLVGMFVLVCAFQFEQNFLNLLVGWARSLPVLGIVLVCNPFVRGAQSQRPEEL